MDGTLAASSSKASMTELRIFALLDYKSEVWSFQFRIKLPVMELWRIKLPVMELWRFQEQGDWLARIVSGQCDVFVSCFGWLLHYDKKGTSPLRLPSGGHHRLLPAHGRGDDEHARDTTRRHR
ncbi:hypothetical protein EJB05_36388, partial [Eragrostis curvula]